MVGCRKVFVCSGNHSVRPNAIKILERLPRLLTTDFVVTWAETLAEIGGDGEIRTLGKVYTLRRFSKPLVSATHPRLRTFGWRRYSEGARLLQWLLSARKIFPKHARYRQSDSVRREFESSHRPFIVCGSWAIHMCSVTERVFPCLPLLHDRLAFACYLPFPR
jgi:hypothetical protein